MNPFYRRHVGDLLAGKPPLGYAVAFHAMYIAGIVYFALPLVVVDTLWGAALTGLSTLAEWLAFRST